MFPLNEKFLRLFRFEKIVGAGRTDRQSASDFLETGKPYKLLIQWKHSVGQE